MKKIFQILIVIMLVVMTGCSIDNQKNVQQSPLYFGKLDIDFQEFKNYEILDKGENFVLYQYIQTEPYNKYYWYNIYNENKNIVLNGGMEWKEPQIIEQDNIVSVTINSGTLADKSIYYNTKTGIVSQEYNNVLAKNGSLICFFENNSLIITDIFDKTIYHKAIKKDFAEMPIPIKSIESFDNSLIKFSYYSSDNTLIEETITLNNHS